MKSLTVILLLVVLFIASTNAQVPFTAFVKLPRFGSHKRALHFSSSPSSSSSSFSSTSFSTIPDQISQQHLVNNWLLPLKLYKKRNFSGIPLQDDELLIPLMKKGHIPRGPPRFGKRGGATAPSNHLRLRQFSLYGPMLHLMPRNNEMQEFNPYEF